MLKTIKNEFLTVTVSEDGAELHSILGADGTEYLWQGDPAYWSDRALNIFPFVARLFGGEYELDGERRQMKIHGIAPYRRFKVEAHSDATLSLVLASDKATRTEYPRDFLFRIRYELCGNTLAVTYEVENHDKKLCISDSAVTPASTSPFRAATIFQAIACVFRENAPLKEWDSRKTAFSTGPSLPSPLTVASFSRFLTVFSTTTPSFFGIWHAR